MKKDILELAVMNNALWCNTICALHNAPGMFSDTFWITKEKVPLYYPNIITLKQQRENFVSLMQTIKSMPLVSYSIKDSYDELSLLKLNFSLLFEAEWIAFQNSSVVANTVNWSIAKSNNDLVEWDTSIIYPELLHNTSVHFIIKRQVAKIIAGAILNCSEGIIGVSNIFHNGDTEFWTEMTAFIRQHISDLPIVGYERGDELLLAENAKFKKIGKLKVWKK